MNSGYIFVSIKLDESTKIFNIANLVYCIFNGMEYNSKLKLIHIDKNMLNNSFYNLRL